MLNQIGNQLGSQRKLQPPPEPKTAAEAAAQTAMMNTMREQGMRASDMVNFFNENLPPEGYIGLLKQYIS